MADITTGWTFGEASEMDWSNVGPGVDLKMLAGADERGIALFKFAPGYEGTVHEHLEAEFSYILEGELISMGVTMKPGGAYAAAGGTTHDEFRTDIGCTLVSVFAVPSS